MGELVLDDYEGRFWPGLHRHVDLVMLALWYPMVMGFMEGKLAMHATPIFTRLVRVAMPDISVIDFMPKRPSGSPSHRCDGHSAIAFNVQPSEHWVPLRVPGLDAGIGHTI